MISLSYNLSPALKERLEKIESMRREILLTPLSPKIELQIRWKAMIDRIHSSLILSGHSLTKPQIIKVLTSPIAPKKENDVLNYKKALDYINQYWLVSHKTVLVKDVLMLYDIFCKGRLRVPLSRIQELLDYLQAQKEHPAIEAGIANLGIVRIRPFTDGNGRLARLLALLFLYKEGFDIKGFSVFEKTWAQDRETFRQASQIALNSASITLWLEFFAQTLLAQLRDLLDEIKASSLDTGLPSSFWEISDRQKRILSSLDEPGAVATNKKIQKQFEISQITASRDLSKLASLGLIFSHGKGRSVYYTKV